MKHKICLSLVFITLLLTCKKQENIAAQELSISDFKNNLKSEMVYTDIVAKFGEPAKDVGSGIHIYVYVLNDSTEIWIGYVGKIIYARHVDQNRQIIQILI
jgi:hypothetical protein